MTAPGTGNRAMFWRIVRRLLGANRGRLFVILLALGAGAAVTAALLNLQVDAKRRLTSEFRAFGPNVLVLPKNASQSESATLPESIVKSVPVNLPQRPCPNHISSLFRCRSCRGEVRKIPRSGSCHRNQSFSNSHNVRDFRSASPGRSDGGSATSLAANALQAKISPND